MSLYFIALIPPEKVKQEIKSFKEEVKQKYGVKHALKLPAHITLQKPFKMDDRREQDLLEILDGFSEKIKPFDIEVSGFGKFEQRAVFVDVQTKDPVKDLFEKFQKVVIPFVGDQDRQNTIYPHLTIATRDLDRQSFLNLWPEFKERKYVASFKAAGLNLFKHNGKTWDNIKKTVFIND